MAMARSGRCLSAGVVRVLGCTVALAPIALRADAAINLELRPASQVVTVGATVELGLYAVSDSESDQLLSAVDVILSWQPEALQLLGTDGTGAVTWLASGFFSNDPYNLNEVVPPQDGDGIFSGLGPFGEPIAATPEGTLLTTFLFEALCGTNSTPVDFLETGGSPLGETTVYDGEIPNLDVTGSMTGAEVQIVSDPPCPGDISPAGCGDGAVNVLDLIDLLLCFGQPAAGGCAVADINQDDDINVLDLIELLLGWGDCPP